MEEEKLCWRLHCIEIWENKHRNQHEEIGYGGLEHISDASREVVGQNKRRDGPLSHDRNRFGSIRR